MTIVDKAKNAKKKLLLHADEAVDPKTFNCYQLAKIIRQQILQNFYKAGWNNFGENYVQELAKKHDELPADINWYMIGHLQRNKVKYIADYVTMIQSVDSLKLMNTIEKERRRHDRIIPILIEVNVGEERE